MSILQEQITQSLDGLSEENLSFLLEMIHRFMMPAQSKKVDINDDAGQKKVRRLGSMKGQKFIADGHDIDECNAEIAEILRTEFTFPADFDSDRELEEAREAKYGSIG